MDRLSTADSTSDKAATHGNDPLAEPCEWMHSGAPPVKHQQSYSSTLRPPSTAYLGDPHRTLTLLSSDGLRASDLLGRPMGWRQSITGDLRLLPTQYRRANLSLYPWTSRQTYGHRADRSNARPARGGCRRLDSRCCDQRRPFVVYSEWRAMVLRAIAARGWGYVSCIDCCLGSKELTPS